MALSKPRFKELRDLEDGSWFVLKKEIDTNYESVPLMVRIGMFGKMVRCFYFERPHCIVDISSSSKAIVINH